MRLATGWAESRGIAPGLSKGRPHDSLNIFLLSVLRQLWARDVFSAVAYSVGAEQEGFAGYLSAEFVSGMERDWMDRRAGVGGEARCTCCGEVTFGGELLCHGSTPIWTDRATETLLLWLNFWDFVELVP